MAKKKRRSRKKRTRRLIHERLEQRRLLAGDIAAPWQNVANPLDINADGDVTPLDALALGMAWGSNGPGPLGSPSAEADGPMSYVDVDGDGALTAQDFDAVFTHLNGLIESGDGVPDVATDRAEGEPGPRARNVHRPWSDSREPDMPDRDLTHSVFISRFVAAVKHRYQVIASRRYCDAR